MSGGPGGGLDLGPLGQFSSLNDLGNRWVDTSGPSWVNTVGARGEGGGIASILGTIAGIGLAPETGGLSLAIPAAIGAGAGIGGNLLGDLFTGSGVDPLSLAASGVGGGITGGVGAELGLGGVAAGGGETAAGGADPFGALSVNPDLEGVASQAAQAGAPSSALVAPEGGAFAQGSMTSPGPVNFGDPVTAASPATPASTVGTGPNQQPLADAGAATAGFPDPAANATPGVSPGGGMLSNISDWLGKNKNLLGPASLIASLGKSALFPSKIPGQDMLNSNAGLARNIAETNANGLNPAQAALSQQQIQGQIAAIKAKYAQLGLSGSTAEQQDIEHAQNANLAASSQAITNNAQTALSAIGSANASTLPIAQQQLQDDKSLGEAIALLAAMSMYGGAQGQGA